MVVNRDFKNNKTNRLELDDLQTTYLLDSSKMIYCSKDANVILIVMRSPKTQSSIQFRTIRKISNYCFLFDGTLLYYCNTIVISLLIDKLNFKCFVLYENKELLTTTKIYITIINILIFCQYGHCYHHYYCYYYYHYYYYYCYYHHWLYVLVMPRTRFRVNPHYIFVWMSRNSLLEAGARSEG